jgi:predicted ATPase
MVEELGRRILAGQITEAGGALRWVDLAAFAARAIELSRSDRRHAEEHSALVFFDRL